MICLAPVSRSTVAADHQLEVQELDPSWDSKNIICFIQGPKKHNVSFPVSFVWCLIWNTQLQLTKKTYHYFICIRLMNLHSYCWLLPEAPSSGLLRPAQLYRANSSQTPGRWVQNPPGCNRHHQTFHTFLVGNHNLNLHLPLESWLGGVDPRFFSSRKGILEFQKSANMHTKTVFV